MNIAKLNTVSLDDKTFIIKRGTSGGATINNQDKVVDITENGTTEIVADGGYTGLGKVIINTEVSGGGESVEYWDITAAPEGLYEIAQFATMLKYTKSGTMYIDSIFRLSKSEITPIGVAIDTSLEHLNKGTIKTVGEIFNEFGYPSFDTIGWVRLTKEQFYSFD